jgi:hypothetical protein
MVKHIRNTRNKVWPLWLLSNTMIVPNIVDKVCKGTAENRYIDHEKGNPVASPVMDIVVVMRIPKEAIAPL